MGRATPPSPASAEAPARTSRTCTRRARRSQRRVVHLARGAARPMRILRPRSQPISASFSRMDSRIDSSSSTTQTGASDIPGTNMSCGAARRPSYLRMSRLLLTAVINAGAIRANEASAACRYIVSSRSASVDPGPPLRRCGRGRRWRSSCAIERDREDRAFALELAAACSCGVRVRRAAFFELSARGSASVTPTSRRAMSPY